MKKFVNPVVELISLQETDKIMSNYIYNYGVEWMDISDPDYPA